MTVEELYQLIGGDYTQATNVLRMDKLIDKHIRKLTTNGVVDEVLAAGQEMDPTRLFEAAHAMKGVCANLGLPRLAEPASTLAEEFRPGNSRQLSDDEVAAVLQQVAEAYEQTKEGISQYAGA